MSNYLLDTNAAIVLQQGLIVLTKDKHFENVDGLQVQSW